MTIVNFCIDALNLKFETILSLWKPNQFADEKKNAFKVEKSLS